MNRVAVIIEADEVTAAVDGVDAEALDLRER